MDIEFVRHWIKSHFAGLFVGLIYAEEYIISRTIEFKNQFYVLLFFKWPIKNIHYKKKLPVLLLMKGVITKEK